MSDRVPGLAALCGRFVEDDAFDDSADSSQLLFLAQPGERLEGSVLAAEDVGDGHGRHRSGYEGGVCCLVGEVVAGDVCTVTGETDDLDVDEFVAFYEFGQAEGACAHVAGSGAGMSAWRLSVGASLSPPSDLRSTLRMSWPAVSSP